MRAVQVTSTDGPRAVQVADVPAPTDQDGLVLVEVRAAGVTFPDVLLTRGTYQDRPPYPFIPGLEAAGVVLRTPESSGLRTGDRVAALPMMGGFAEQVAVPVDQVFPLPDHVSFETGAALPVNYLTVEFGLNRRAGLQKDETVLVHGAAGGVGTAAIQYAKMRGATVIAVVSSEEKADVALAAGAHHAVYADRFVAAARELTDGRGVDIVLDPVGGERFADSLRALAADGRLVVVGFAAGEIPSVRVNRLLFANIGVIGAAWGEYAMARPGFVQRQWKELLPGIEAGVLAPPIGKLFPLADAGEAMASMEERRAVGRAVLQIGSRA